jgi:hypothetical protein
VFHGSLPPFQRYLRERTFQYMSLMTVLSEHLSYMFDYLTNGFLDYAYVGYKS